LARLARLNERSRIVVLAAAVATLLIAPAFAGISSAATSSSSPSMTTHSTTVEITGESSLFPTPIRHVFVIVMEDLEASQVAANLNFETYLEDTYSYASDYYSVCHPSAPNYVAITAGSIFGQCGSDGFAAGAFNTTNVGTLVQNAGESWDAFMESMPSDCDLTNTSLYSTSSNPFLYFPDIVNNGSECDAHDVPFTNWYADVNASATDPGAIPNYAFFAPNLDDNGYSELHVYSDAWLGSFVNTWFLDRSFMQSSVLFITYDEGNSDAGYVVNGVTLHGGNVPFYAISPYTLGVRTNPTNPYPTNSSHYNLLSTTEWLLGLGTTGNYDNQSGYFPAMKGLFNFNDTAVFPPLLSYQWTNLTSASPTAPSPRAQAAEVYDAANGSVLLFGGHNASESGEFSDTWTWQNGVWTQLHPTTHPSSRRGAAITYDPDCGCAVLIGGSHSGAYLNDTWTFKAGVWTNITATLGNSGVLALRSASLAYDPENDELVLFGGHQGAGLNISTYLFMNQTWLLPGDLVGAWALLHPTSPSPGAGAEAGMVWDPSLHAVVLNAGYDNFTILSYTWAFVNNTWTELLANGPPSPRSGAAIADDPALGGVVDFAGNNEELFLDDVWLLTGTSFQSVHWTSLWAYPSPPHRAVGRGIYDPATEQFVVFGGQYNETGGADSGAYLNDTWAFGSVVPATNYPVSGAVDTLEASGISDASVFFNSTEAIVVTTTDPTGDFSVALPNGSYEATATASGFLPSTQPVSVSGQSIPGVDFSLSARPALPAAPTGVSGSASGPDSIALGWTNPVQTLTDDYVFYEAGTVCSAATEIDLGAVVTTATVDGLSPGTLYCVYVEDTNLTGASAPSATIDVTTVREPAGNSPVTFTETGLPPGASWSVTLNGSEQGSTRDTITFSEPNGTYSYDVGPPTGYGTNPSNGTLTVAGTPVSVNLAFQAVYPVTFTETGLPNATDWALELTGDSSEVILFSPLASTFSVRGSGDSSNLQFSVSNGSYTYSGSAQGYANESGTFSVAGASPAAMNVPFTATHPGSGTSGSFSLLGLSPLEELRVLGGLIAVGVGVVVALARRRSKTPPS
jgi:phosphoesterase family protein/carboxypeptidase family protein/fibronectin type III domain protein